MTHHPGSDEAPLPFPYTGFEFDSAQRLPLLLCLDASSSLATKGAINALNAALTSWADSLVDDMALGAAVDVAMITFGGPEHITVWQGDVPLGKTAPVWPHSPFVPAHEFRPPHLRAHGVTLLDRALRLAMEVVADYKAGLRTSGLTYYRPQICVVTDGYPSNERGQFSHAYRDLLPELRKAEEERRFRLFAVGVGEQHSGAEAVLEELAPNYHAWLDGFPFKELLAAMSHSARAAQGGAAEAEFQEIFARLKSRRGGGQVPA
ncbi:vWA domain-containing protein [Streptomyces neyagawaensis]|uniref:VWFA domain-containing protein n=1 Tax=Streptomyces neyagawaensis TaxID=42238 RepID=A0ABV3B998_9ACTN